VSFRILVGHYDGHISIWNYETGVDIISRIPLSNMQLLYIDHDKVFFSNPVFLFLEGR
jgi:hypothetical protein